MELDAKTYLEKLNDSILLSKNANLSSLEDLTQNLIKLSSLLRVARIEVRKEFNGKNNGDMFGEENPVIYTSDDYDPDSFFIEPKVGNDFVFADYYFFNRKNESPFSEDEKHNLSFLAHLIYLVAS
ncbi:MAG: hypothetical protein KBS64_01790, partial [Treponema sp.]|nr:hypothetical protein [Candidatus Treponema equi]